jgi:RNA polymerase sigma-70 factor, ECF subfamily
LQQAKADLLVIEAQAGNQSAFAHLYRHYNAALLRFAYRFCADEQLAGDAVQEAWITLSKSLKTLKDPRGFRIWAYKTVRWRVVDQVRKGGALAHGRTEPLDEDIETGEMSATVHLATSSQLSGHLAKLPSDERQALALFYLEEMKLSEIAAILDVPIGTVKSRLNRARGRLREQMTGEDDD